MKPTLILRDTSNFVTISKQLINLGIPIKPNQKLIGEQLNAFMLRTDGFRLITFIPEMWAHDICNGDVINCEENEEKFLQLAKEKFAINNN